MPVYIGSGAQSTPDCTHNATLTIVGDAAGMNLVTYFNITAGAFGFVTVTGTLNLASARPAATLTAVAIVRPTAVASIDFVTYGKLLPGETTKTVTDGHQLCSTLDSIWIAQLPPSMSGTGGTKGGYGPASTGGTRVSLAPAQSATTGCGGPSLAVVLVQSCRQSPQGGPAAGMPCAPGMILIAGECRYCTIAKRHTITHSMCILIDDLSIDRRARTTAWAPTEEPARGMPQQPHRYAIALLATLAYVLHIASLLSLTFLRRRMTAVCLRVRR